MQAGKLDDRESKLFVSGRSVQIAGSILMAAGETYSAQEESQKRGDLF